MTIVAIVGADGVDGITVARSLEASSPVPVRYYLSTHHDAHRGVKHGPVALDLRKLNRLAEASCRQLVSRLFELRGCRHGRDRRQGPTA
jgi:hypothetical protein